VKAIRKKRAADILSAEFKVEIFFESRFSPGLDPSAGYRHRIIDIISGAAP
jgi:hypothetical protein